MPAPASSGRLLNGCGGCDTVAFQRNPRGSTLSRERNGAVRPYNGFIAAAAQSKEPDWALRGLQDMMTASVRPNIITLLGMSCSLH